MMKYQKISSLFQENVSVFFLITLNLLYLILSVNGADTGTTDEIIRSNGYPVEEHITTSSDGFQIVTHRIPSAPYGVRYDIRIPVLIFHPQMMSSAVFVDNTKEKSLAFILADQGYDVWLTNVRGNRYSKKNQLYSTSSNEYWDFSYQESALFDLPPLIDYILTTTKHQKLFYIGYSMGATIGFFLLSALPEYNQKLHGFLAVAPVVFIDNMFNTFQMIILKTITSTSLNIWPFNRLLNSVNLGPFNLALKPFCGMPLLWRYCLKVSGSLSGDGTNNVDGDRMNVYMSHFPDTTSMRTFNHYFQNKGEKFRMYDFGTNKNTATYQQATPPDLNLAKVTAPVAIFNSKQDKLANTKDVEALIRRLTKVEYYSPIDYPGFGHGSFMWGLKAPELLFKPMLHFMATKVQAYYFPGVAGQEGMITFLI